MVKIEVAAFPFPFCLMWLRVSMIKLMEVFPVPVLVNILCACYCIRLCHLDSKFPRLEEEEHA